ncbi:MAG: serine hydrolase domain-containing protein [Pseudomonadota bacterium]
MVQIHGLCDDKFAGVKAAFESNFRDNDEIGACVAITHEGAFVVDLWGGHLDRSRDAEWTEDTIINVWSSTKTMAAMCMLVLADRRALDLQAPVSTYWPEFAEAGKGDVKVCHFLSHTAGLSGMDTAVEGDALYDWDWMTRELAAQAPWWEPGTKSGYHALTQGHLIGEVVRRITGQSLGSFFKSEIADPLEADFHIGVSEDNFSRICKLTPPASPIEIAGDGSIASRTFANPAVDVAATASKAWRQAEIPAANGHGNARSIVRVQTAMANGGSAFGKQILSEAGTKRIFEEQARGTDMVLGVPMTFGMGYGISSDLTPLGPNRHTAYWGGYGGSVVLIDQDARLCISYVMNRMEPGLVGDMRGMSLVMAAYQSLLA